MIVRVSAEGDRALIRNRAPLLLSGRTFTSQEIEDLRETVRMFRRLSWGELVRTVCEHLDWVTPTGRYKVGSCGQALRKLFAPLECPARLPLPDAPGASGEHAGPNPSADGLARTVRRLGERGLIQLLRETCSGPWLDAARIQRLLASPCQLRLE
jgi:hypothetical protein